MLGSVVIKGEKHSEEGRHLLAKVVRELSKGGDEELVGNQASLFGQRSMDLNLKFKGLFNSQVSFF